MHICKFYIIFAQLFTQRYNAMNKISKSQIRFIRSLAHKKERDAAGVFVAEGIKCTEELLGYFEPLLVAATAERLPQLQSKIDASILYEASGKDIEMMSSLRTPQGEKCHRERCDHNDQDTKDNARKRDVRITPCWLLTGYRIRGT